MHSSPQKALRMLTLQKEWSCHRKCRETLISLVWIRELQHSIPLLVHQGLCWKQVSPSIQIKWKRVGLWQIYLEQVRGAHRPRSHTRRSLLGTGNKKQTKSETYGRDSDCSDRQTHSCGKPDAAALCFPVRRIWKVTTYIHTTHTHRITFTLFSLLDYHCRMGGFHFSRYLTNFVKSCGKESPPRGKIRETFGGNGRVYF